MLVISLLVTLDLLVIKLVLQFSWGLSKLNFNIIIVTDNFDKYQ